MEKEQEVNAEIQLIKDRYSLDTNLISDGYHTFGELYEHRIALFIALCKIMNYSNSDCEELGGVAHLKTPVWRSRKHSDGELAFGGSWFVLGIGKETGRQITYHLPLKYWGDCEFSETLDVSPEFDGHTSADVLERLKQL